MPKENLVIFCVTIAVYSAGLLTGWLAYGNQGYDNSEYERGYYDGRADGMDEIKELSLQSKNLVMKRRYEDNTGWIIDFTVDKCRKTINGVDDGSCYDEEPSEVFIFEDDSGE